MTDFRALCGELMDALANFDDSQLYHESPALIARARAALAEGAGVGPTDEELTDQEIEEWADAATEVPLEEMDPEVHGWRRCFSSHEFCETIRAAIARYGTTHPRPIPVAERMPTAADCDAKGRCWWYDPDSTASFANWTLAPVYIATDEYFWWLPAAAIPLPEVGS